jgi:uncharacterized protein YrrD
VRATQRIQFLIGLPVLHRNGKAVGKVKDVWFDEFWNLAGIVLESRVWFRHAAKIVGWDKVVSCGEDSLIVRDGDVVEIVRTDRLLRSFQCGVVRLKEMPVYTVSGTGLGRIADVYLKQSEGTQLIGYELTDGFLADVFEGRRRLFLPEGPESVTMGEDAILVPDSYERVWTRDPIGKVTGEDG